MKIMENSILQTTDLESYLCKCSKNNLLIIKNILLHKEELSIREQGVLIGLYLISFDYKTELLKKIEKECTDDLIDFIHYNYNEIENLEELSKNFDIISFLLKIDKQYLTGLIHGIVYGLEIYFQDDDIDLYSLFDFKDKTYSLLTSLHFELDSNIQNFIFSNGLWYEDYNNYTTEVYILEKLSEKLTFTKDRIKGAILSKQFRLISKKYIKTFDEDLLDVLIENKQFKYWPKKYANLITIDKIKNALLKEGTEVIRYVPKEFLVDEVYQFIIDNIDYSEFTSIVCDKTFFPKKHLNSSAINVIIKEARWLNFENLQELIEEEITYDTIISFISRYPHKIRQIDKRYIFPEVIKYIKDNSIKDGIERLNELELF